MLHIDLLGVTTSVIASRAVSMKGKDPSGRRAQERCSPGVERRGHETDEFEDVVTLSAVEAVESWESGVKSSTLPTTPLTTLTLCNIIVPTMSTFTIVTLKRSAPSMLRAHPLGMARAYATSTFVTKYSESTEVFIIIFKSSPSLITK